MPGTRRTPRRTRLILRIRQGNHVEMTTGDGTVMVRVRVHEVDGSSCCLVFEAPESVTFTRPEAEQPDRNPAV